MWEIVKQEVKMLAIERLPILAYETRGAERTLNANFQALLRAECETPGVALKDLESVKDRLDRLPLEPYRGAIVRFRSNRYLLGEPPTKRTLADEKRYALRGEIGEIEQKRRQQH